MSKKTRLFYIIIAITILISLYDIYLTVLTVDTIHLDEINPLAKKIILYGKEERSYNGVAMLVMIKCALLCVISVGTSIFHYSESKFLHSIFFYAGLIYFAEHLLVLGVLLC